MGSCSASKAKQSSLVQWNSQQSRENSASTHCNFRNMRMQHVDIWTEYDDRNPHRQYNVILNGVLFQVINSVQGSFENVEESEGGKF